MFDKTLTLKPETRIKLTNLGILDPNLRHGFYHIVQMPTTFKTVFPELSFTKNRIPEFFELWNYLEYLGFHYQRAQGIWNSYHNQRPKPLMNPFTLLIQAKNHIRSHSDSESTLLNTRCKAFDINHDSTKWYIPLGIFGLTADIIQDVDTLLKKTKEDKKEMDRYLDSSKDIKKVEDLLVVDFIIEIIDRRFTKLFTFERDAKVYLEGLQ